MNVIFHTATAVGIFTAVNTSSSHLLIKASIAFFGGIMLHGILDYTPHCYPISAKVDILISAAVIMLLLLVTTKKSKLLFIISILGNTFPDLVDLGPSMINKYLGCHIPIIDAIFPWHWKQYSGSIYRGDCIVSDFNHWVVLFGVITTVTLNGYPHKRVTVRKKR